MSNPNRPRSMSAPLPLSQGQAIRKRQQSSGMAPTAQQIFNANMGALTVRQANNRANLMSLIRLRGAVLDASGSTSLTGKNAAPNPQPNPNPAMQMMAPPSVDINIHGTFARGASWVQNNSAFSQNVRRGRNAITTNFQWSGSPLEAQRQVAGAQLENFIRDVQNPVIARGLEVNAFAHSHGGNVLGHAMSRRNVSINNAVLLGTPHMSDVNNVNVSWTRQGTDQVQNMISSFSAPNDLIQTTGATMAELVQGNARIARRSFQRPDAMTPLFNFTTQPLGNNAPWWMPSGVQAHSDLHEGPTGNQVNTTMRFAESNVGRRFLQALRGINMFRRFTGQPNNPVQRNVQV